MSIEYAQSLNIQRLYHYQSFNKPEHLATIFVDKKLYYSSLERLNDPWDCRPFFRKPTVEDAAYSERVIAWIVKASRKYNPLLPEIEQERRENRLRTDPSFLESQIDQDTALTYESFKKQYRVYCLSECPDSILMWAHYGDSCRGVCLEFSTDESFFAKAMRVEYPDTYPHLDLAETDAEENAKTFATKASVWNYEHEFRLVATQHPHKFGEIPLAHGGMVPFPAGALRSIILGPLMPQVDRELVHRLAKSGGWNVGLKEARILPDRYGLIIQDAEAV